MNLKLVTLSCLLLMACQPSNSQPREKKVSVSPDTVLPHAAVDKTADRSHGQCHALKKTRQFFRFASQPKRDHLKFSLEDHLDSAKIAAMVPAAQLTDIQSQLEAADVIYQQVLGLRPPLQQSRYTLANFINITIAPSEKAFGRTYDEVVSNTLPEPSPCFIGMTVSSAVIAPTNPTPAHELFHVYQNGYMMFKQAWLTEGLARWSESLFRPSIRPVKPLTLPQNQAELMAVMKQSYAANKMWFRLFELVDDDPNFVLPKAAADAVYLSGDPIVPTHQAYGTEFIKVLFEELEQESITVSQDKGWAKYGWKEKDQKDPALNLYIWQAIRRAVNRVKPEEQQSQELRQFLSIEL